MAGKKPTLRERLREAMEAHGLNVAQLACHVPELSATTVHKYMADYPDSRIPEESPRLTAAFEAFLDRASRGEVTGAPDGAKVTPIDRARRPARRAKRHYETEFRRRAWRAIDYAADEAAIVLVLAEYGAGKTTAAQMWRAQRPEVDSIYLELDAYSATRRLDFTRLLMRELGMPRRATNNTLHECFLDIVERLRERPALLIFDQCEAAHVRVLQVLRQIHDRTRDYGVGVALLSAPALKLRLETGRSTDLGALLSRISATAALSAFDRGEMAGILQHEGVEVDEGTLELWFHASRGSMRAFLESLALIQRGHREPDGRLKRVTQRTVLDVFQRRLGVRMQPLPTAPKRVRAGGADGERQTAEAETSAGQ